jgi:hypothetical protein
MAMRSSSRRSSTPSEPAASGATHVTLSFQAKEYDGSALFPYLVVSGRATVKDGGALAVMDHLAQWYIGPGATYPARDMPSGWTFRVLVDKFYGQGPWNDRWVEMDGASRGGPAT